MTKKRQKELKKKFIKDFNWVDNRIRGYEAIIIIWEWIESNIIAEKTN